MATKKTKVTEEPEEALEAAENTACSCTPAEQPRRDKSTVTAIVCALLQSPRFAGKLTDDSSQKLMVDMAAKIADKIDEVTA